MTGDSSTASGEVYAWGWNDSGLIGNVSHENQLLPMILDGFDGEIVKSILVVHSIRWPSQRVVEFSVGVGMKADN